MADELSPAPTRADGLGLSGLPTVRLRTEHPPEHAKPRMAVRVPRITIHAYCDCPDIAATIESAATDRLMSRAQVTVKPGGVPAAVDYYRQAPTPNLIIVDSRSASHLFLSQLDSLAEVCDAGTRVMTIGHVNDILLYRELMKRGISEYVLAPVDPVSLIASIASIYGDATSAKLGQVCAFVGARGGVGSSTVAHNVSWSIARQLGLDVAVVDLDLPFGTAGLNFNVDPSSGIAEALQDPERLDEVLFDRLLTRCGDNLSLLSAPAVLEQTYDLRDETLEPLLDIAQTSVPFVILDMPHIWTTWTRSTLLRADEIVITASPDLANLRSAKNLAASLRQARPNDPPPKLVLNQVGVPRRPEIKPGEFAKAVQLELTACIPFDAQLFGTAAINGQMTAEISRKATASKAFAELADVVTGRQFLKRSRNRLFGVSALLRRKA